MTELFRREAVAHSEKRRRLSGAVVLATPLSIKLLTAFTVIVMLVAAVFAGTATYARKETVPGWLAPEAGLIRVSAQEGGVIETVHVGEGDMVGSGQPLVTVRMSNTSSAGDVSAAMMKGMASEALATEARLQSSRAKLTAEERNLQARKEALARELAESRRQASQQQQRVQLARQEVERANSIAAQGFLPRRELDLRRSAELASENELSALRVSALALEREIGEVDGRLSVIPEDLRAIEAESGELRATMVQRRTEVAGRSTQVAAAGMDSRVAALPVRGGQSVRPGTTLAVLAPRGSAIEAELYVPSGASGFIRPGQPVRLMLQAFPHQKFGSLAGTVISVSRTPLAPEEVAVPGLRPEEPVLRVRVQPSSKGLQAYGEPVLLQPGMSLSASIIIDRRTLLEWLLDPLYAAGRLQ